MTSTTRRHDRRHRARPLAAAIATVLLASTAGCGLVPPATTPVPNPTGAGGPGGPLSPSAGPTQPGVVYFPRDSPTTVRLAREVREVPQADPLRGVLEAMIAGPSDPDYLAGWPAGTRVLSASTVGDVTTVDLSGEARSTTLGPDASLSQVDQLLWTVTELVGPDTAVALAIDGRPAGELWGVTTWDEPRRRDDPMSARLQVAIDSPLEGARVSSPVTISGDAAVHEGRMPWRVLDQRGAVVTQGEATTTSASGEFAPYSFDVELPAGQYTVEVRQHQSDGEGWRPDTENRSFVVGR